MATMAQWIESEDCVAVDSDVNGHGRGDGYDVCIYRSVATGRYLVSAWRVGGNWTAWYVARTLEDARAVGRHGYTPGAAPGRYEYIRAPWRLREVRRLATAAA